MVVVAEEAGEAVEGELLKESAGRRSEAIASIDPKQGYQTTPLRQSASGSNF